MTGRIVLILAAGALLILLLVALARCEPYSDPPGGEPMPEAEVTVVDPAPAEAPPAPAPPQYEEPLYIEELPDTGGAKALAGH